MSKVAALDVFALKPGRLVDEYGLKEAFKEFNIDVPEYWFDC